MKKTVLRNYAKLIATMGVNVRKDQDVIINAELEQPEFVYMVAEECYKAGARKVTVDFDYQPLQNLRSNISLSKLFQRPKSGRKQSFSIRLTRFPQEYTS